MKVHIKRWHNGIGEPKHEEAKESRTGRAINFSYNQPYGMNDLSLGNRLGKEKELDIIEVMYQVVLEQKENLRKIKEIKGFFNELYSLSSAQPVITTGLSQTPIIEPIIPPVTTSPLQPTPPISASASSSQEQKEQNINPLTAFANLFYTSTFMTQDLQRRLRRKGRRRRRRYYYSSGTIVISLYDDYHF